MFFKMVLSPKGLRMVAFFASLAAIYRAPEGRQFMHTLEMTFHAVRPRERGTAIGTVVSAAALALPA